MAIMLHEPTGALKQFRRTVAQYQFQQTFRTPRKNLSPFIAAMVGALQPIRAGMLTVDQVIFEPRTLAALLDRHGIALKAMDNTRYLHDWSLHATGEREVEELLTAALSDPIDFAFVPDPGRLRIYADHDEYVTFFSARKSGLGKLIESLARLGFLPNSYSRRF